MNITIGLALVAFVFFEYQGFKHLGIGGYLGKFFPFDEFRNGIGAGIIAMFVGLVELLLEFVKPVTLSMRLFGNIYGGEVALGVITALTIAIIPMAMYRPRGHAQPRPGPHLQHPDAHVHAGGDRAPRRRARRGARAHRPRPTDPSGHRPRPTDQPRHLNPANTRVEGGISPRWKHFGAGLAALGVLGPGIGIGILAGMSSSAIGRNPDAAGQIRGLAIILAAFAEGLGVLAIVVGLLAIFSRVVGDDRGHPRPRR